MCASKNIAMLMRVKHFYCNENMLLLVNLYVRILDITHQTPRTGLGLSSQLVTSHVR